MNTLTRSSENIQKLIKKYMMFFEPFERVYLFGSSVDKTFQDDIDILLLYNVYSNEICNVTPLIRHILQKELQITVDITILSIFEEKEVGFLERLKDRFIRLK